MSLVVAPCDHAAAKYAVMNWHYSERMPVGKLVKFGVWEYGQFVGSIIYGRGASDALGSPYDLGQTEVCELVRVAFKSHEFHVSQAVAKSMKLLRGGSPGLRLVVSFADPVESHHGGIYQAGNWLHLGVTSPAREVLIDDKWVSDRTTRKSGFGNMPRVDKIRGKRTREGKYRYVYPLDKGMRRKLTKLAQPYPKRADEGSPVSRPTSGGEGQVRSLPSAQ